MRWSVVLATLLLATLTGTEIIAAERPNIILILADDLRADVLGYQRKTPCQTPHLDALAKQGVRFENTFCTTSICSISRASYLTGQYARRHQVINFNTPLTPAQWAETFPAKLRAAGYRTGLVGKWGLGGELPREQYDYFTGYSGQGNYFAPDEKGTGVHLTDTQGDECLTFLDGCRADQPFLLQWYTKAPHCQDNDPWPFQPAPRFKTLYQDLKIPLPPTGTPEHFAALPKFLQESEGRVRWKIRFETPELYQESVKDYYRLITGIDDVVGRIVERLKKNGLAENTVIIFSSDNGMYLGEHGLADKWFMHEESIRLPLFLYDPRLPQAQRGKKVEQIALNLDVAPTILALAGLSAPEGMQGQNLLPLITDEQAKTRDEFFYEHRFAHPRIPQTEGVRTTRWKYTRYVSVDPVYEELFDLETDPHETRNLASQPEFAKQLEQMRTRWMEWQKRAE